MGLYELLFSKNESKPEENNTKNIEETPSITIINNIEAIERIGCSIILDMKYHDKYLLKTFCDENGIYFPDLLNNGLNIQVVYRQIPSYIINEYIFKYIRENIDNIADDANTEDNKDEESENSTDK